MTILDASRLEREIMLRTTFPAMPATAHARLVELLEDVRVEPGQVLFSPGQPSDRILFLTEGRVVMECEGEPPWYFTPVAVIGVIDATLDRPRKRGCRALEPSKLLALRSSEWFDMLEDNPQIARGAIRNIATNLLPRWRELAPAAARHSEPPAVSPSLVLENYDKILALRQAGFVRRAGMQALVSLAAVAEAVELQASATLFAAGENEEDLYVVASGLVELSQGEAFRVRHGPGDLIGGPAALCRALKEYSTRSLTTAALLRISEHDFYDRAEEHPRLTRGALAYLVSEFESLAPFAPLSPGEPETSK